MLLGNKVGDTEREGRQRRRQRELIKFGANISASESLVQASGLFCCTVYRYIYTNWAILHAYNESTRREIIYQKEVQNRTGRLIAPSISSKFLTLSRLRLQTWCGLAGMRSLPFTPRYEPTCQLFMKSSNTALRSSWNRISSLSRLICRSTTKPDTHIRPPDSPSRNGPACDVYRHRCR